MYPHERSLVKKMENKPFVLLGINSDPKDHLKETLKKENITWPSWWDGGDTSGPIARAWNVSSWPTTYVLDAKGVIRFKNVRGEEMDKAVEQLLAEIEKDANPGATKDGAK
jgi:peroxiredoxin